MTPKAEKLLASLRKPFNPNIGGQWPERDPIRELAFLRANNFAQKRELEAYRDMIEDLVQHIGELSWAIDQDSNERIENDSVLQEICQQVTNGLDLPCEPTDYMRALVALADRVRLDRFKAAEVPHPAQSMPPVDPFELIQPIPMP